jgi:Arylsulfatase A and related enzymes
MKRILLLLLLPCLLHAQKKPNIVIILADDLGWGDVGYHGSSHPTPHIDQLAREGAVLNRFYTAPICSPTRAGMLTGRYPNRFGLRANVIPPWSPFGVDTTEEFIPQMLAQAGYTHRAAIGKWHLGHSSRKYLPLSRGFTHFYGHYNGAIDYFTHEREGELDWHNDEATCYDKGYSTDLITNEAVKCIKRYAGESPFFVYVAYNAPHSPFQAKKEDLQVYGRDTSGRDSLTYAAMVTAMDRGIGQILQSLKDAGVEDNTLVIFFSDNGSADTLIGSNGGLRGMKFQEWDGGVRAPAIVKWPGVVKGRQTIEQVMGYIDIAPTLRQVAGVTSKPPKPYDGMSMLPVWKGEKKAVSRSMYLGFGTLIYDDWKIVKANMGNPKMEGKEDMLFNIVKDPGERRNVRAENEQVYARLNKMVAEFDDIKSDNVVPGYHEGRKGFKAPREWKVE